MDTIPSLEFLRSVFTLSNLQTSVSEVEGAVQDLFRQGSEHELLRFLIRQRLTGLVYYHLQTKKLLTLFSLPTQDILHQGYFYNLVRHSLYERLFASFELQPFFDQGHFWVTKGFILALTLYPTVGCRTIGDLDFLMHPRHFMPFLSHLKKHFRSAGGKIKIEGDRWFRDVWVPSPGNPMVSLLDIDIDCLSRFPTHLFLNQRPYLFRAPNRQEYCTLTPENHVLYLLLAGLYRDFPSFPFAGLLDIHYALTVLPHFSLRELNQKARVLGIERLLGEMLHFIQYLSKGSQGGYGGISPIPRLNETGKKVMLKAMFQPFMDPRTKQFTPEAHRIVLMTRLSFFYYTRNGSGGLPHFFHTLAMTFRHFSPLTFFLPVPVKNMLKKILL